jgi:hypothetical protein
MGPFFQHGGKGGNSVAELNHRTLLAIDNGVCTLMVDMSAAALSRLRAAKRFCRHARAQCHLCRDALATGVPVQNQRLTGPAQILSNHESRFPRS